MSLCSRILVDQQLCKNARNFIHDQISERIQAFLCPDYPLFLMVKVVDRLVRDKLLEKMLSSGDKISYHVADDEEYKMKLKDHVLVSAKEFHSTGNVERIVDILDSIEHLLESHGLSMDDVERIKQDNHKKKGTFRKKLVLDTQGN